MWWHYLLLLLLPWIILQIGKRSDENCPQMTKQGTKNFVRRSFGSKLFRLALDYQIISKGTIF